MKDRKRREQMGRAGRKRAVEMFSWPVAAKNTFDVYADVIEKHRRRS